MFHLTAFDSHPSRNTVAPESPSIAGNQSVESAKSCTANCLSDLTMVKWTTMTKAAMLWSKVEDRILTNRLTPKPNADSLNDSGRWFSKLDACGQIEERSSKTSELG
jgi:hypothetical protein